MFKLFIVFLFLTFSQSAYADWLDIVKDGLESTIEVSQDTWNIAKKTFDEDEGVSEELIPKVQENIVKNLVELHDGEIIASNRLDTEGAIIEIRFPRA